MITVENLSVDFPEFRLTDINLSIENGDFFVLIGPTGAGKTVLLEALVGLIPVDEGKISIKGAEITHFPPEKRGIGIVYQDYALFPHLTVVNNIKYGLHFHKIDGTEAQNRLSWLLDRLNLNSLVGRFPTNLSGGELQRVALARALIVNPSVLLLDEPLSALDPNFRVEIQTELKRLHKETDITFLMVTHDFSEVLSLANRVAVMNQGKIEQIGEVSEIFEKPCSPFVADFVGIKNVFKASFNGTSAMVSGLKIEIGKGRTLNPTPQYLAIRPEDVIIGKQNGVSRLRNHYSGIITQIDNRGFYYEVVVRIRDVAFKSLITKGALIELGLEEGISTHVSFNVSAVHIF